MTTSTDGPAFARVRLHVAYDGTPFRGFAANDGVDTIAGRLNDALSTVARTQSRSSVQDVRMRECTRAGKW